MSIKIVIFHSSHSLQFFTSEFIYLYFFTSTTLHPFFILCTLLVFYSGNAATLTGAL
jgi:hypothetical protein